MGYELKPDAQAIQVNAPRFVDELNEKGETKTSVEFYLKPVYDIKQTTAESIQVNPTIDLNHAAHFKAVVEGLSEAAGTTVIIGQTTNKEQTEYDKEKNNLTIQEKLGVEQTVKSLIDSTVQLSADESSIKKEPGQQLFENQAISFMIADHLGLPTEEYSFNYVTTLAEQKQGLQQLNQSLDEISKKASSIINKVDQRISQSMIHKNERDKFEERVSEGKEKNRETIVQHPSVEQEQTVKKAR